MSKKDLKNADSSAVVSEGTAADTLAPNSMPADAPKSAKIASVVDTMSKMNGETINKFMEVMAQFGGVFSGAGVPDGTSDKNASTIVAKGAVKEDVESLFADSEDLSEEFKQKAVTIFEAALNLQVNNKLVEISEENEKFKEQLQEEFNTRLTEEVENINAFVVENLNKYLDYVVKTWMEENEVAISHSLKNEMTEKFILGLKNLFVESFVEIPEEKVDVLDQLNTRVLDLEEALSESIKENMELKEQIDDITADKVFADVCEGLATTQVETMMSLSEGIEYNDLEELKSKLQVIKENFFKNEAKAISGSKTKVLFEEVDDTIEDAPTAPKLNGPMAVYVDSISKALKNR